MDDMPRKKWSRRNPVRRIFSFDFLPGSYLPNGDAIVLNDWLREKRGWEGATFKGLRVFRGRKYWFIEIPHGFFSNTMTDASVSFPVEEAARIEFFDRLKRETGELGFNPWRATRRHRGVYYYGADVFYILRTFFQPSCFFNAFYQLVRKLNDRDPLAIKQVCPKLRKVTAVIDRPLVDGHRSRGPDWSKAEDYVLSRWFGRHLDGKHHRLREDQWRTLLDVQLAGVRTKTSVKARLSALNNLMKRSLLVEGYLPREGLREYKRRFLGERYRAPTYRPRPGYHHPIAPRKRREQPETTPAPPRPAPPHQLDLFPVAKAEASS